MSGWLDDLYGAGYDTTPHVDGGGQEVLALTGSSGVVTVRDGARLNWPADPKTAISWPIPSSDGIKISAKREDTSDEYNVVGCDNAGGIGGVYVGDEAQGMFEVDLTPTATQIYAPGGTIIGEFTSAGLTMGGSDSAGLPIAFGTAPAQSGLLRVPAAPSLSNYYIVSARNADDDADYNVLGLLNAGGDAIALGDNIALGAGMILDVSGVRVFIGAGGTHPLTIDDRGIRVGPDAVTVPSGTNTIGIGNGTAPSSNPTGGGVLYVESGALKYRGSSGTITTLGAA